MILRPLIWTKIALVHQSGGEWTENLEFVNFPLLLFETYEGFLEISFLPSSGWNQKVWDWILQDIILEGKFFKGQILQDAPEKNYRVPF